MRITEIKNKNKIVVPQTNINKVVSRDILPPIPNKVFTAQICGTCNSGKSVFVNSLLTQKNQLKRKYHTIILVAPATSAKCFKSGAYSKIKEENVYNELTGETMDEIIDKINTTKEEGEAIGENYYTLVIFDDVQSSLKDKYVYKKLNAILSAYVRFSSHLVPTFFIIIKTEPRNSTTSCAV